MRPSAAVSLLAACASIFALGACGSASKASNGRLRGSTITLYSGQHEQTTTLLVREFERESGITVQMRFDGEQSLGNQIIQEGSNSPADVFFAENTPVLEALEERGLLAPVSAPTLAAVPRFDSSATGEWVGVSARESVLVYSPSLLSAGELPRSLLELAQPRWKGKLGFAPSETDFQPLLTAIGKLDGEAAAERWLEGIVANSKLYPDNETVLSQVENGQSAAGLIDHYYWFRLRDEVGSGSLHAALHYFAPGDPGNLLNISGAAVLRSSEHRAAAQAFLAYLVGRRAQEIIAHSKSYEYPLRPGVSPAPGLRPLAILKAASLTPAQLGDGKAALALEQKLGLL